jgi:hypothetical protein
MACFDLCLHGVKRAAGFACNTMELNGGPFWTVPELLFESKKLIAALQLLLTGRQNDRPSTLNAVTEARLLSNKVL